MYKFLRVLIFAHFRTEGQKCVKISTKNMRILGLREN